MKKIIASVMLACFGASILIAEVPAAVAASDPFAGVEGVELSAVEEGAVEGGIAPVVVAVVAGKVIVNAAIAGGISAVTQYAATGKIDGGDVAIAAIGGALTGAIAPLPPTVTPGLTHTMVKLAQPAVKTILQGTGTSIAVAVPISAVTVAKERMTTNKTTTTTTKPSTSTSTTSSKPWYKFW